VSMNNFFIPAILSHQKTFNMKKLFLISALALCAFQQSRAQSCQSLFSKAESIFNDLAQDYIEFRMEAAQVFVDYIIPGKDKKNSKLDELFDKATDMQVKLYRSYGIITGGTTAHIGGIELIVPVKKWEGACYTERQFTILSSPYDKVVIRIKKTDGKRGLKIAACSKHANGSPHDKKEREIESGKETAGVERTITFEKDMLNKNITLHLVASGALPTDKCEYTLEVEGFFDEKEMEKIAKENKPKDKKPTQVEVKPVMNEKVKPVVKPNN
jgi:hypothetical protein